MIGIYAVNVTGIPALPQTGPDGDNVAIGFVAEILAIEKSTGVVEIVTLPVVITSPRLFTPDGVDATASQRVPFFCAIRRSV